MGLFSTRRKESPSAGTSPEYVALVIIQKTCGQLFETSSFCRQHGRQPISEAQAAALFAELFLYYFALCSIQVAFTPDSPDAARAYRERVLTYGRAYVNRLKIPAGHQLFSDSFDEAVQSRLGYYLRDEVSAREHAAIAEVRRICGTSGADEESPVAMESKLIVRVYDILGVAPSELLTLFLHIHYSASIIALSEEMFGTLTPVWPHHRDRKLLPLKRVYLPELSMLEG